MAPTMPANVPRLATITLYCWAICTASDVDGLKPAAMLALSQVRSIPPPDATLLAPPAGRFRATVEAEEPGSSPATRPTIPRARAPRVIRRIRRAFMLLRTEALIDTVLSP